MITSSDGYTDYVDHFNNKCAYCSKPLIVSIQFLIPHGNSFVRVITGECCGHLAERKTDQ